MRLLGIDPGTTGAAALYSPLYSAASGLRWVVIDLPSNESGLNVPVFRDWLRLFSPDMCCIEAVTPNPKFGIVASVRLVGSYRAARAVVECCDIPVLPVGAPVWKRALGLKAGKEGSMELARDMFPDAKDFIKRKLDHNRAEAMLIAFYGSRRFGELI